MLLPNSAASKAAFVYAGVFNRIHAQLTHLALTRDNLQHCDD